MANTIATVSEVGQLLKVPSKVLETLVDKMNLCIGSAIYDARAAEQEALQLNIGIGTLSINLLDMQCKFIPSKDLKATIKRAISEGVDPLELKLEEAVANKLLSICTEVL